MYMHADALSSHEIAVCHERLAVLLRTNEEFGEAVTEGELAVRLHRDDFDLVGEINALGECGYAHLLTGRWGRAIENSRSAVDLARRMGGYVVLNPLKGLGWAYTYSGQCELALRTIQEGLQMASAGNYATRRIQLTRRLAEVYDRQLRWAVSNPTFETLIADDASHGRVVSRSTTMGLLGVSYLRQGRLAEAEALLLGGLLATRQVTDPTVLSALGVFHLRLGRVAEARRYFETAEARSQQRPYYKAQALLGQIACDLNTRRFSSFVSRCETVERIAGSEAFDDHLGDLMLAKAAHAWMYPEMSVTEKRVTVLRYYRQALLHGTKCNRFLVDQLLNGHGSMLTSPSINSCLVAHGTEGAEVLAELWEWWQEGRWAEPVVSSIAKPVWVGQRLTEVERSIRGSEPGGGDTQVFVSVQIERALS
jgi:tetratricopeptide (TPR) repeat protein